MTSVEGSPGIMPMFETFRAELDEHHDRRERIVKISRDITAVSKKIIFGLQRSRGFPLNLPEKDQKTVDTQWGTISQLLNNVAPDLQGINAWRYQKQISWGMQEMVEAKTFQDYLRSGKLSLLEDVGYLSHSNDLATKSSETGQLTPRLEITEDDYILGVCDMTGELMRFAITGMATKRDLLMTDEGISRNVLTDLRCLSAQLESLVINSSSGAYTPLTRDLEKKMEVTRSSVEKVEGAAYGLAIRGRERPKGWTPDLGEGVGFGRGAAGKEEVESY